MQAETIQDAFDAILACSGRGARIFRGDSGCGGGVSGALRAGTTAFDVAPPMSVV